MSKENASPPDGDATYLALRADQDQYSPRSAAHQILPAPGGQQPPGLFGCRRPEHRWSGDRLRRSAGSPGPAL